MKKNNMLILLLALFSVTTIFSFSANARCTNTLVTQTEDGYSALLPFGRVNMTDTYFQPVGSVLASIVVPSTSYKHGGATASSILWECDKADLPDVYFLVATNGDDRDGGFFDIGGPDGLTDVYGTKFAYVGLRQTMAGVSITRTWKKVPLQSYTETSNGKIQIKLADIPPLQAELIRISSLLPISGSASAFCGTTQYRASSTGTNYACNQPNSYIQLVGPGLIHDQIGEDSAYRFLFWGADNGFGYRMQNSSLSNNATCVARNATPYVLFPTVPTQALNDLQTREAQFSVQVECSDAVSSGISGGQTAIGIQVSPGAFKAASNLGLINAQGGVQMLLSDNYETDPNIAKGVGISLYNSSTQKKLVFLGQPDYSSSTPWASGTNSGWYPVLEGAQPMGPSIAGYSYYQQQYTAVLGKIPGQTVTAGRVYATAYVIVKVQ
ncbi:fimbrial protein [Providencia rettgeri]|uniref:fimbrial protein n=1 Tax=Providencia sp. PROV148 TaxID=2949858 RepID=UPI00234AFDB8|nr:fimbrial protein [Providencia sp. PROV148]EJD6475828.1 fimbrial protein [Providencia rettgeri]ELR5067551.1 fimbrial protein [Providencia rettgeri]ELR5164751.1 fimbrial protein [Providencia rettgeri]